MHFYLFSHNSDTFSLHGALKGYILLLFRNIETSTYFVKDHQFFRDIKSFMMQESRHTFTSVSSFLCCKCICAVET